MILAVCGGKGGVGKSTVSLNLAHELDAVAVDADLTTPDLPRGRGPDLHDVLAGRASPLEAVEEINGVSVLPCGRTLAGARAADLSRLTDAVTQVHRQYGRVVIDCPAGLARDVGYQLHSADAAVLVTRPKKPALLNAFRTRHLAHKVETPVAAVALNQATGAADEEIAGRLKNTLGAPTTVVGKHDAVAESQEQGTPVREAAPDCPAADAFGRLARSLAESERQISGRAGTA